MTWRDKITPELMKICNCTTEGELLYNYCPVEVDGPELDEKTQQTQYPHRTSLDIIGCRGLECFECWEQEAE